MYRKIREKPNSFFDGLKEGKRAFFSEKRNISMRWKYPGMESAGYGQSRFLGFSKILEMLDSLRRDGGKTG